MIGTYGKSIVVEQSEWSCELFGCGTALVLRPTKENEPNAFWRWMQYICFGNRWVKDN